MTLIWMYIKRVVRDKENIVFFLVTPLFLTGAILLSSVGGNTELKVGIYDKDKTPLTQMLIESLEKSMSVIEITEDELEQSLIDESLHYALVIDKGYTQGVINEDDVKIQGYSIRDSNISRPIRIKVEDFMNAAHDIAIAFSGNDEMFYTGMEIYTSGMVTVSYMDVIKDEKNIGFSLLAMNLLVMGMMIMGSFAPQLIIKDKEKKTFYRMLMAPINMKKYVASTIISFFAVAVGQLVLMLGLLRFVFGVDFNNAFLNIFVALIIFSAVCVSFGIWVMRTSKSVIQASLFINIFVIPSLMLGGAFWPREIMPGFLQMVGNFTPVSWIIKILEELMGGASFMDVYTELGVVALFALVFFLVGSFRKADVVK